MRILVTGGAGFIGSHIVDRLLREGHEVVVLDSIEKQVHANGKPDYLNPSAEFIRGDIRDIGVLGKALEGAEVVFHEAAAVGVGQSMYEIRRYVDVNTMGTAILLDHLANSEHDVKKLLVASSMSIYGEGAYRCKDCGIVFPDIRKDDQLKKHDWEMRCPECGKATVPAPTNEDKPLRPTSIYAITKRDQEEMCHSFGKAYGVPTVALRYFNVFGQRQSLNNPYTGVCAIFSARIKNGEAPLIFEDGRQSRDFVFVEDIAEANILAMNSRKADYQSFNVGTGKPVSILEVSEILSGLYGKGVKPQILGSFRSGDIRHCFADTTKIRSVLGFSPKHTFDEGMRMLVEWGKDESVSVDTGKAYAELTMKGLA